MATKIDEHFHSVWTTQNNNFVINIMATKNYEHFHSVWTTQNNNFRHSRRSAAERANVQVKCGRFDAVGLQLNRCFKVVLADTFSTTSTNLN